MGVATSDGEYFENEFEYVAAQHTSKPEPKPKPDKA